MDAEDARELTQALNGLHDSLSRARSATSMGNATINVNAGGLAVWVAATSCVVMLLTIPFIALWMAREFQRSDTGLTEIREKQDVQQAYLNVLMQTDQKPEPKQEDK